MAYSEELTAKLEEINKYLEQGETVLVLFEDMFDVNDHFQATLDWFKKEKGNKLRQRFGQSCYLQRGFLYFVGADVHDVPTRGVAAEIDLRPWSHELVRTRGLEARLREKGLVGDAKS